jgi:hypothetical protein
MTRWLAFKLTEKGGTSAQLDDKDKQPRIRCPKCAWQPKRGDRWMCKCEHMWNTFDTRGLCPACGHQWRDTACPRCHEWSPHDDWYTDEAAP